MKKISLIILIISILPLIALSQRNMDGSMPQYLLDDFTDGRVKMKNGQELTEYMNYNTVTERMVYIKEDKYWDLANPQMVDTVYLDGRKFVPSGKHFNEVLVMGKYKLFVRNKGTLMSAGAEVGYGGKSQLAATDVLTTVDLASGRYNLPLTEDFIVNPSPVFYIESEAGITEFTGEKQFLEVFGDKSTIIKDYMKKNKLRVGRIENLIQIVEFCNKMN